jgi:serine/threonine protein kinase
MGAVYEADAGGQRFAVKVLHERPIGSNGDATLARFVREAQVTSTLSSPHVVPTYDGGIDHVLGLPYLVMPLLHGEDLDSLIGRVGPLHPTVAVRLVLQAAHGIMAAHAAGVIHRDIKPQNIFLDQQAGVVTAKVCDFGLAKAEQHAALTATGSMLGSPLYMAPEQIVSARKADLRADVWSLGMTLYHALCGAPAHHEMSSFAELAIALTSRDVPHLQEIAPWIDPALAVIVHGTLLRDVHVRCPSIGSLYRALSPFAGGNEQVTTPMLAPLPPEMRASIAPRAAYPHSWSATSASFPPSATGDGVDPLLGKRLAGRYDVVSVLGKGGMGAVYEGRAIDGTPVAIKVIGVAQQSPEAMARFVREARAAMSIQSPHVVRVLDADTDPAYRVPFIVMELLRGTDLDRLIKDSGPLEPRACAAVFDQALAGLEAAHALGVVHRDIKPANLFLHEEPDGHVVVKVCDFGVAKQLSTGEPDHTATDLTRTGGIVGSPMYMSPEQAKNAKTVDHRTDVWSLAMSMHQALSGRKPWESASTVGELIVAICTQTPTPVQDVAPWVEAGLAEVVQRGLARDAAGRWSSSGEMRRALVPFSTADRLTRTRLTALSPGDRDRVAPRSLLRGAGAETVNAQTLEHALPPRRAVTPIVFGALAVVAITIGGAVAVVEKQRPMPAAPSAPVVIAPATASSSPSVAPAVTAHIVIKPSDGAIVTVDGAVKPTEGGRLAIAGAPGDSFDVVVTSPHGRGEARVVLGRDGSATPASIDVVRGPTPHSTAGGPAPPAKTADVPPKGTTPATTTAPPPPPPTTPKPKDTW